MLKYKRVLLDANKQMILKSKRRQSSGDITVYRALLHIAIMIVSLIVFDVWFVFRVWG